MEEGEDHPPSSKLKYQETEQEKRLYKATSSDNRGSAEEGGDYPPRAKPKYQEIEQEKRPCKSNIEVDSYFGRRGLTRRNQVIQEVAEGRGGCSRDTRLHLPRP